MKSILIATDGSAEAARAVELGLELAAEHDSQVVLLHVLPPEAWEWHGRAPVFPRPVEHRADEDTSVLAPAVQLAADRGVAATAELVAGDPVVEIIRAANRLDVDLIVIGSRGLGRVKAALLGSVSRAVLAEAKRPVLVVQEHSPVPVAV